MNINNNKLIDNFVSSKEAMQRLGLCRRTLQTYADTGKIDTIRTAGGWRKYNVVKFLRDQGLSGKEKICYCRVSSNDQKEDLQRQIDYLHGLYPDHTIISDVGSGINFKRKGLLKVIDMAIHGELSELVLTYRDRLCRIGFDLLEAICKKYSNTTIIAVQDTEETSIQEEITDDLVEIITVYSSKLYGSRSHKNK